MKTGFSFFLRKSVNLLFFTRSRILHFRIVQRFRKHVFQEGCTAGRVLGEGVPAVWWE